MLRERAGAVAVNIMHIPKTEVPIEFLLQLHNALPAGNQLRADIIHMMKNIGEKAVKAHWTRAVVQRDDGTLYFDERLYDAAVWRGKQDTYAESAENAFEKLHSSMSFVSHFQIEEDKTLNQIQSSSIIGTPIVPFAQPSVTAARLKEHAQALTALVEKMESGLANGLVQPSLPYIVAEEKK